MNYKVFNVAIPIKENNVVLVDGVVQFDTANIINARLTNGVEPFDFTGWTDLFIEILKPNGKKIFASCVNPEDIGSEAGDNPYAIQVIDAEEGRISFALKDQATAVEGMHFGRIIIMGAGERLSSSRFNYYVGQSMFTDEDYTSIWTSWELGQEDDYNALVEMLRKSSAFSEAERGRVAAENERVINEQMRNDEVAELVEKVKEVKTVYIASETEPDDTTIFWIDTSEGGILKFFDGTNWKKIYT